LQLRTDCLYEDPIDSAYESPAVSGFGGGGIIPDDCDWMTMQITYDGGLTWYDYGEPFEVCDYQT